MNFAAAIIICELDDIMMSTGRIQYLRDRFENLPDESCDPDEEPSRFFPDMNYALSPRSNGISEI